MSSITGQRFDGVYFTKHTKINPNVLGNHPFSWIEYFAFFCEVFKEHLFFH